ncbi:MAG TPA: MFS transporter [Chloroflexota bacterium]|nr:MFS transporter [Chloroflexota bacterium]
MGRSALRENAILAAISGPFNMMTLLIPLYLSHLGYPVGVVGAVVALGGVSSLASRFPVPKLYRPERSRALIFASLGAAIPTCAVMPFLPDIRAFMVMFVLNRIFVGLATTFFLARYLDLLVAGADRRQAMGWYGGTQAFGYTTSNVLVGLLADYVGYPAAFFYGVVFCALGIALLVGAPELHPRPKPATSGAAGGRTSLVRAIGDPGLWSVVNVGFWNNLFHLVLSSFFPVFGAAVGLGPAEVGLTRGLYSFINAIGRPSLAALIRRLTLRQVNYLGLVAQMGLMAALPAAPAFAVILGIFTLFAASRALVVVSNSAGLAEEVDDTRVSRGVATSVFSATSDVSNIVAPLAAGLIASATGIKGMFPIVALGAFGCYVAGDLTIQRWRASARIERSTIATPDPRPST